MKKFLGFTLAEVLITLGITGIIAAITIPMIVGHYNKASTEAKLKKYYSSILQALEMYNLENGYVSFDNIYFEEADVNGFSWELSNYFFEKYFAKYFKIIEKHPRDAYSNYIPTTQNGSLHCTLGKMPLYLLNDGTVLAFARAGNYDGLIFHFILNPKKRRIVIGRDEFAMTFIFDSASGKYLYKNSVTTRFEEEGRNNYLGYCNFSNGCYPKFFYGVSHFCTFLIVHNNFSIPKDYPIKF